MSMMVESGQDFAQESLKIVDGMIGYIQGGSVHGFTIDTAIPYRSEIVRYLKNATVRRRAFMLGTDELTGELARPTVAIENIIDDRFSWCSMLPYYLEKYPIRLPIEVEEHILNKLGLL